MFRILIQLLAIIMYLFRCAIVLVLVLVAMWLCGVIWIKKPNESPPTQPTQSK